MTLCKLCMSIKGRGTMDSKSLFKRTILYFKLYLKSTFSHRYKDFLVLSPGISIVCNTFYTNPGLLTGTLCQDIPYNIIVIRLCKGT